MAKSRSSYKRHCFQVTCSSKDNENRRNVYSGSSLSVKYWENIEIDIPKFITVLKPLQNLGEISHSYKSQWTLSSSVPFRRKQEILKAKWMVTGNNGYAQLMLGHKNTDQVTTWTEMKPPVPFVSIALAFHMIGVAENGEIYSCGYNGQSDAPGVINPFKISIPEPVICVSANLNHSAIVTSIEILPILTILQKMAKCLPGETMPMVN